MKNFFNEFKKFISNVDSCPNSAACQIYKEAREKENTYEKLFL